MKQFSQLSCLGLAALMGLTLTACSSEESDQLTSQAVIKPAKSPDFIVYSGSNVYGSTFATRSTDAQVNVNYFKIQDYAQKSDWMRDTYPVLYQYYDNAPAKTDRDEQVSQAEYEFVINYIKNHPDEGGTTCNLTTYFIQNVGSSYDSYDLAFVNDGNVHHTQNTVGGNQMDYAVWGDTHINDYNAHWGPRALCVGIPVVSPTYHDSYGDQDNTKENAYKFYYIEYEGKTNCYLCYDYRMKKYDNGLCDFQGDGVYNDWVIKLIPADGSDVTVPTDDPTEPDDPADVDEPTDNEVEVNLSVNDEKEEGDYIATKLSIHVRANTDVEVFIPVPAQYYCDADDMNIVLSHRLEVEAHGPLTETMTYNINGTDVTCTVAFEADGIRVTTGGMSQAVLDYTRETYADGVTFEVWNYFRDIITRDELKPYLDAATVSFLSATEPRWYVNAFAKLNDAKNPWDCIVTPTDDYAKDSEHTGDADYNVIYQKN